MKIISNIFKWIKNNPGKSLMIGLVLYVLLKGTKMKDRIQSPIRGVRNNNPLNIREIYRNGQDTTKWMGERATNDDAAFEEFETRFHGSRAAIVLLRNYLKAGYNTISTIVNRWAPPSDGNNTSAYVTNVGERVGMGIHDHVDFSHLPKIAYAMAISEIGREATNKYYPLSVFEEAHKSVTA